MKRRDFVQRSMLAAAATVVAPAGVVAGAEAAPPNGVTWHRAPCRLCGVGCGLLVGVENGRAVAARGDPDSPVSAGLPCVKGYHATQALYASDRLTRALVRRDGRLEPAPLDVALDLVARAMRGTIARQGAGGLAMLGSAQWTVTDAWLASRLFDALGAKHIATTASLDASNAAAAHRAAFGAPHVTGSHEDMDHADVVVLWDVNLAETDPVLFSRILQRKRANPAMRIVDLTTRRTRTSYASDESLLLVPGAELAVARAIGSEIVERGLVRRAFVERHVAFTRADGAAASLAEYRRHVAGSVGRAHDESGLSEDNIRWLASLYGDRTRRVVSIWGASLDQRPGAFATNSALLDIHLLAGKVASPGNAAFRAATSTGIGSVLPTLADGNALSVARAVENGDASFLWIQAANPMVSLPNLSRRRSRPNGGFVVVSDVYPTATTAIADVVLPSALWIEREGIVVTGERRVQHFARLVRPPGDATADGAQVIQVARRLGLAGRFPRALASHVEESWEELRTSRDERDALPPIAELRRRPGVVWPVPAGREVKWRYNAAHDPAVDRARGEFDFYGNPDHRAHIRLRADSPTAGESPDAAYPFRLATGAVLEHSGTGSLTRRIPVLRRAMPSAYAELNRGDAARLGVADGDTVRLVSRRGAIECVARIELRSQPPKGTVFVPAFDPDVPVNMLTDDAQSPVSGQAEPGACAVRIERIPGDGGT